MEVLINISSVKGYLAIVFRITNVYMCEYSDPSSRCISYRSTLYSETFKMTV